MKKFLIQIGEVISAIILVISFGGCGNLASPNGSASQDESTSGSAAGAAGGALSGSGSNGTQARLEFGFPKNPTFLSSLKNTLDFLPSAMAEVSCPTFRTIGSDCSTSSSTMWLNYSNCNFGGSATWNGTQALTMSTGSASCGTFPDPGSSGTLSRQHVQSAGSSTPSSVSLSAGGYVGAVDDATANLGNFDSDTISANIGTGYGTKVTFGGSGGSRSAAAIDHRVYVSGVFDHSITGTLSINEASYGASSRTLSGSLQVYHNLLRVIGTSTFNNVLHEEGCCFPVSGSITTVFSAGTNVQPTALGNLMVGKSETLTLTGCGTGTLQSYDGSTASVTLSRCF